MTLSAIGEELDAFSDIGQTGIARRKVSGCAMGDDLELVDEE